MQPNTSPGPEEGSGTAVKAQAAARRNSLASGKSSGQLLAATILVVAGLVVVRLALAGMSSQPETTVILLAAYGGGALLCLAGGVIAIVAALRQKKHTSLQAPSGNWLVVFIILVSTLLPLLWLGLSDMAGAWLVQRLGTGPMGVDQVAAFLLHAPERWATGGGLLQASCLSIACFLMLWRKGQVRIAFGWPGRWQAWPLLMGALAGLGLWLGAQFIQRLVMAMVPANWAVLFPPLSASHLPVSWLGAIITLGAAPLAEEIFFRGYVFPTWQAELGPAWGLVASAALFGAYALNPLTFLPYVGVGLGLAILTRINGRLAPAWMAHLVFNLLAFLIAWPV